MGYLAENNIFPILATISLPMVRTKQELLPHVYYLINWILKKVLDTIWEVKATLKAMDSKNV